MENAYIIQNFGTGQNDEKHAQNMLERFKEGATEREKEGLDEAINGGD